MFEKILYEGIEFSLAVDKWLRKLKQWMHNNFKQFMQGFGSLVQRQDAILRGVTETLGSAGSSCISFGGEKLRVGGPHFEDS